MTTQTVDQTVGEAGSTSEAGGGRLAKVRTAAKLSGALGSGALGRLAAGKRPDGLPVLFWAVFFRSVVLIADYLLASSTATVLIPLLGAWLHQRSGLGGGQLSVAGTIAMWIAPFAFLVLVLAVGEIAAMRAMWGWATRRIQNIENTREARDNGGATAQATGALTSRPNPQTNPRTNSRTKKATKKASRNRSK